MMWYDWVSLVVMLLIIGLGLSIPIREYLIDKKEQNEKLANDPLYKMMNLEDKDD